MPVIVAPVVVAHADPGAGSVAGQLLIFGSLALATWCYMRGTRALWAQLGRGRVVSPWRVAAWIGGVLTLAVALGAPMERLAGTLFSAHMAQHVLLASLAAPLLALSTPSLALMRGLPHGPRRRVARLHARWRPARDLPHPGLWPIVAAGIHAAIMWLWHLPVLYEAAVRSELIHGIEHVTMLGSAVALWWAILEGGRRSAFGYGAGIPAVFIIGMAHGGLGAVFAFAPNVLYEHYASTAEAAGIGALTDQQAASVVMWAPPKLLHGVALVLLVLAWLRAVEARAAARAAARSGEGT